MGRMAISKNRRPYEDMGKKPVYISRSSRENVESRHVSIELGGGSANNVCGGRLPDSSRTEGTYLPRPTPLLSLSGGIGGAA